MTDLLNEIRKAKLEATREAFQQLTKQVNIMTAQIEEMQKTFDHIEECDIQKTLSGISETKRDRERLRRQRAKLGKGL